MASSSSSAPSSKSTGSTDRQKELAFEASQYVAPSFKNSPECGLCKVRFGGFTRRHHCRGCGASVCTSCSPDVRPIPRYNLGPSRVCKECNQMLGAESRQWKQHPDTLVRMEDARGNWTADPRGEVRIARAKRGLAALDPHTVTELFELATRRGGDKPALKVEREIGKWETWSFQRYRDEVWSAARALLALGFQAHQSVNVLGFNSPEWFIANIAAIVAGGKAAGIYTTNNPEACFYISEHSEAAVVVCENEVQLKKFLGLRERLPALKALVVWTGAVPEGANADDKLAPVLTWEEFLARGKETRELTELLNQRIAEQRPGHCCTLIYTSGTTGPPKAVMLSHDNITWNTQSMLTMTPTLGRDPDEGESFVSFLPLSHVAAQLTDIHAQIAITALYGGYATVWFARPDALKGSLVETIKMALPTVFFGVPRVWEKMEEKIRSNAAKITGLKARVAKWAQQAGGDEAQARQVGGNQTKRRSSVTLKLADTAVFSKIRQAIGFDRVKYCFSGAAPIAHATLESLARFNIIVCELYGMSENTGPQNSSVPEYFRIGACGRPLPGCEMKIDHVEGRDKPGEGELCFRGRHVMMGYMKSPEKTAEAIDDEGFLHSGDVGRLDEDGLLFITGRIKELIIGAGGENIAPVPIEDRIKAALPAISNCMMVGDKRKYNTALITLRQTLDLNTGEFGEELVGAAKEVSPESKTVADAIKDPKWQKYIEQGIKVANAEAVSNAAKVQKFAILPVDFSVNGGELTPTLKLKRQVVAGKYADIIESLYAGDE